VQVILPPAPYFGGKRLAAPEVWRRFGTGSDAPRHTIIPFAGMLGELLGRPGWTPEVKWLETVNDVSGLVVNVWRAIAADPEGVAQAATWPCSELDLQARKAYLQAISADMAEKLRTDPHWFDVEAAGWWVWGANLAIGRGWGNDDKPTPSTHPRRGKEKSLDLGARKIRANGYQLRDRISYIGFRAMCGDWRRVLAPSMFNHDGVTAVFFDPPYAPTKRDKSSNLYGTEDADTIAEQVRAWCVEHGDNTRRRIALCGYGDEHAELEALGWDRYEWTHKGGYSNQGAKDGKGMAPKSPERIWFSPHCLSPNDDPFAGMRKQYGKK
jgi:hypothetical protein